MAQGVAGSETVLTNEDKALLTLAQLSVPIEPRPFGLLGERLGLSEESVIARLKALKETGFIRKIGPVVEPAALGLASELVAAKVLPERLDRVGAAVAAWPEVTHCYGREHEINLWFAGVAAASGWFGSAAAQAAAMDGVQGVWRLPTIRRFKIAVHFELAPVAVDSGEQRPPALNAGRPARAVPIDLLRAIQPDLPLCPEPFRELAQRGGFGPDEMMAALTDLVGTGVVRRYGALVSHRRLGFTANAMVVMAVPPERVDAAGARLAESPHVSHCYQRPAFPAFPYTLYAMIHGRHRGEGLEIAGRLAESIQPDDWQALFSTREYGKSAPDYARLLQARANRTRKGGASG